MQSKEMNESNQNMKEVTTDLIEQLQYNNDGLIPAIVQDANTKEVLMLAYMNKESLTKSILEGKTCFFSRSRQELWLKGETSGHFQHIKKAYYDCDKDTLLFIVEQVGVACHTGAKSCFHNPISIDGKDEDKPELGTILTEVFEVINDRKVKMPEGSYTTYLFEKGQDKILKKVGEEATEVTIASKNNDKNEISYEVSDLIYHLMVLLANHDMTLDDIANELKKRR